ERQGRAVRRLRARGRLRRRGVQRRWRLRQRQRRMRRLRSIACHDWRMAERPVVGITVGDPAGIGPEIARKAAADDRVRHACEVRVYGPDEAAAARLVTPGELSARAGRAAYEAIVQAVTDARFGRIDAVATAPVNKEAFALAGFAREGHTPLLPP